MPFKSDKVKYGLPHKGYPVDTVVENEKRLMNLIHLDKEPVAITLLFDEKEFAEYPAEEM